MKPLILIMLSICSFMVVSAQDSSQIKIRELELRVRNLEERMAKIENSVDKTAAKKMMKVAQEHAQQERKTFKSEDIESAEKLYMKASQNLSLYASKVLLDSIVSTYPKLNRAGCAQLYRAQQETGREQERLLKDCMARFSTCYYFDGTQIGPMAIFELATYYRKIGEDRRARELFERLRKESPEAVGHDGELLVDKIN